MIESELRKKIENFHTIPSTIEKMIGIAKEYAAEEVKKATESRDKHIHMLKTKMLADSINASMAVDVLARIRSRINEANGVLDKKSSSELQSLAWDILSSFSEDAHLDTKSFLSISMLPLNVLVELYDYAVSHEIGGVIKDKIGIIEASIEHRTGKYLYNYPIIEQRKIWEEYADEELLCYESALRYQRIKMRMRKKNS